MNRTFAFWFLGLASVFIGACQPRFYRMAHHPEPNFALSKRVSSPKPAVEPAQAIALEVEADVPTTKAVTFIPVSSVLPEMPTSEVREKPKAKKKSGAKSSFWKGKDLGKKKTKKSARKPVFKARYDGFWIGGGLLGIAMLLSLINFPSLALLFGLVSLLFFIFAIKKLLKRRRRRQRFRSRRSD